MKKIYCLAQIYVNRFSLISQRILKYHQSNIKILLRTRGTTIDLNWGERNDLQWTVWSSTMNNLYQTYNGRT